MILEGASTSDLKKMAVKEGMITLRMSALAKMKAGLISMEEVIDNSAKDEIE
jgi:type IV pilus assembly protein PilB